MMHKSINCISILSMMLLVSVSPLEAYTITINSPAANESIPAGMTVNVDGQIGWVEDVEPRPNGAIAYLYTSSGTLYSSSTCSLNSGGATEGFVTSTALDVPKTSRTVTIKAKANVNGTIVVSTSQQNPTSNN